MNNVVSVPMARLARVLQRRRDRALYDDNDFALASRLFSPPAPRSVRYSAAIASPFGPVCFDQSRIHAIIE